MTYWSNTRLWAMFIAIGSLFVFSLTIVNSGLMTAKCYPQLFFSVSAGFVIPKGWRIYVYTREINYDPFLYPEPLTFNPWRWMVGGSSIHTLIGKVLFSFETDLFSYFNLNIKNLKVYPMLRHLKF